MVEEFRRAVNKAVDFVENLERYPYDLGINFPLSLTKDRIKNYVEKYKTEWLTICHASALKFANHNRLECRQVKYHDLFGNDSFLNRINDVKRLLTQRQLHPTSYNHILDVSMFIVLAGQDLNITLTNDAGIKSDVHISEQAYRKEELITCSMFIPEPENKEIRFQNEDIYEHIDSYENLVLSIERFIKNLVESKTLVGLCLLNGHGSEVGWKKKINWLTFSMTKKPDDPIGLELKNLAADSILRTGFENVIIWINSALQKNERITALYVLYQEQPVKIIDTLTLIIANMSQDDAKSLFYRRYHYCVIIVAYYIGFALIDSEMPPLKTSSKPLTKAEKQPVDKHKYERFLTYVSWHTVYHLFVLARKDFSKGMPRLSVFIWGGCFGFGTLVKDESDLVDGFSSAEPKKFTVSRPLVNGAFKELRQVHIQRQLVHQLKHFFLQVDKCKDGKKHVCCLKKMNERLHDILTPPSSPNEGPKEMQEDVCSPNHFIEWIEPLEID